MRKIWSYIAIFFVGLAAGIVAGVKLMGDQVTIEIRKIKTKRGEANVDVNLGIDNAQNDAQTSRQQRLNRKAERKKLKNIKNGT